MTTKLNRVNWGSNPGLTERGSTLAVPMFFWRSQVVGHPTIAVLHLPDQTLTETATRQTRTSSVGKATLALNHVT
jgi:hypothetical protein